MTHWSQQLFTSACPSCQRGCFQHCIPMSSDCFYAPLSCGSHSCCADSRHTVKHHYLYVCCSVTSSWVSHSSAKEQSYSFIQSSQKAGVFFPVYPKLLSRSYSRSQPVTARSYLIPASLASELQDICSHTQSTLKWSGC